MTSCPCSVNVYQSGHHINSISRVARPSPRPTTRVDFDDGLFLCCLGICALCFALKISSSAERVLLNYIPHMPHFLNVNPLS